MKAPETETVVGTDTTGASIQVEFEGFDDNDKPEVVAHVINKGKVIYEYDIYDTYTTLWYLYFAYAHSLSNWNRANRV